MKLVEHCETALERVQRRALRLTRDAMRKWVLARPFSASARERLLLVSVDDQVARTQIDPFLHYAAALHRRAGFEVREVPVDAYLQGLYPAASGATTVCFQSSFDITREQLSRLLGGLREQNPSARLVYLDWCSPTDLRLADMLAPHVDTYVKKHVLRDRRRYGEPTLGDTSLVEHYSKRYGLEERTRVWRVPEGFFDKVMIGPSFVTEDVLLRAAQRRAPLRSRQPRFDVHARLAVQGEPWYRRMRAEALAALERASDLRLATGGRVHPVAYLRELSASRLCFSPFGYGETCRRDYEAVVHGAVLVKPDMSHIETDPDIFVANETYVPVRWDFADVEEKVRWLLGRPGRCREIAHNAYAVLHEYVRDGRFVDQMLPALSGRRAARRRPPAPREAAAAADGSPR